MLTYAICVYADVCADVCSHALSRHVDSVIILDPAAKRVRQVRILYIC